MADGVGYVVCLLNSSMPEVGQLAVGVGGGLRRCYGML